LKGDKQIKINPEAWKNLVEFKQAHFLKTYREAVNKLINEAWHTRLYLKYFLEHRDARNDEPPCLRRMMYQGLYFCCKLAPRIVELPTLDICVCCKFKVIARWEDRAEHPSVSTRSSLDTQEKVKQIREVFCKDGGLYVRKSKCDRCQTPCEKKALFT
jgi:hypothetical protein